MKYLLLLFVTTTLFSFSYTEAQKQKKLYPLGERIAKRLCTHTFETDNFLELKKQIETKCPTLKPLYVDALAYYLHDRKREKNSYKLSYTKKDKCPVCGMFVYKYPKWVTMLKTEKKSYYFDGIKDMMKFYFLHKNETKELIVRSYYSAKLFDATKGYFVYGSDIYGPMGEELIAFKTKKEALEFVRDHHAKGVVTFSKITPELIRQLDE